jgi:hypothetical protein
MAIGANFYRKNGLQFFVQIPMLFTGSRSSQSEKIMPE